MAITAPEGYVLDQEANATPPPGYVIDAPNTHTLMGAGKNLLEDIGSMGDFARDKVEGLSTDPLGTVIDTVKGIPAGLAGEFERLGGKELFKEDPNDQSILPMRAIKKFGQAVYDKPLTTALDLTGLEGGVKSLVGKADSMAGALGKTAPIVEESANVTKTAIPVAEDVAKVAEPPPPPPSGPGVAPSTFEEAMGIPENPASPPPVTPSRGPTDIPGKISDYLQGKYEKIGDQPIKQGILSKYTEKSARDMTLKTLGASPGMVRKIGIEGANKLADYANKKGLINIKTGDIGLGEKVEGLHSQAGEIVGDMRQLASQRGGAHNVDSLISDIKDKLGSKYEAGIHSGEKGAFNKALDEITKRPTTPDAVANTISDLFAKAKNDNAAAGIRHLGKPTGPFADVARELRKANEGIISKTLSPAEYKIYQNALEDYGATTQLKEFLKMKDSREMGGRLPPGMGIMRAGLQKGLDTVGYRGLAQIQNNVSNWLKSNPEATTTPKELFRHYLDEAVDAASEAGEGLQGLAHGGIVGKENEMNDFLDSKYGGKRK